MIAGAGSWEAQVGWLAEYPGGVLGPAASAALTEPSLVVRLLPWLVALVKPFPQGSLLSMPVDLPPPTSPGQTLPTGAHHHIHCVHSSLRSTYCVPSATEKEEASRHSVEERGLA